MHVVSLTVEVPWGREVSLSPALVRHRTWARFLFNMFLRFQFSKYHMIIDSLMSRVSGGMLILADLSLKCLFQSLTKLPVQY